MPGGDQAELDRVTAHRGRGGAEAERPLTAVGGVEHDGDRAGQTDTGAPRCADTAAAAASSTVFWSSPDTVQALPTSARRPWILATVSSCP